MRRETALAATAAVAVGMAAAIAARAWWEPRRLRVREEELAPPGWPARLDGLRVALVSDLHVDGPSGVPRGLSPVVRRACRLQPDAVLLLGDLMHGSPKPGEAVAPEALAERLRPLAAAPQGAIAVLGNHDWERDGGRLTGALKRAGIRVLENEAVVVGDGARRWWAAGVGDATKRVADLDRALAGAGDPVILLSHDPDVFPRVPDRVSLTVSGHTHGGQVAVPGLRALWTPSRFGARYARGHVVEDGRHLIVSRGIGTSRWPIRLGAPPELVLLTLRA